MQLALVLALAAAVSGGDDLLLELGDPAPPFAMRDLDRQLFSLRDHTGPSAAEPRKAIVLAFFATWCKPCKTEIPFVKKVFQRWKGRDVEIVYVGLSQGAKELQPFAEAEQLPWPVVPDTFGLLARRYGVTRLPHLFIIDGKGTIAFQQRGVAPRLDVVLDAQLARITGRRPPAGDVVAVVDEPRFARTLRLGRVPSSEGSAARWQPLGAFLGEAVAANVEVTTEASYEAFEKALDEGRYDLANAGPLLCNRVKKYYEPLARIERQGSPGYFGILFTRRNGGPASLADLAGKTVGLVSARSTSGGLYPLLALVQAGLVPGKTVAIQWLGSHSRVAAAVADGSVDAGGCYEDCRDAVWPDERAKAIATRILSYTSLIPAEMIIVKRDLDAATKKKLAEAMLVLNDSPGMLAQISEGEKAVTAVLPATEQDLDAIDGVVARVRAAAPGGALGSASRPGASAGGQPGPALQVGP